MITPYSQSGLHHISGAILFPSNSCPQDRESAKQTSEVAESKEQKAAPNSADKTIAVKLIEKVEDESKSPISDHNPVPESEETNARDKEALKRGENNKM